MQEHFFILLKQELLIAAIMIVLLVVKLREKRSDNQSVLLFTNILLVLNLAAGFFFPSEGWLFGDMFHTNALLIFEKNLLNLGALIISLQSYHWLKNHSQVIEFYLLLLSTLMGMFFMISSNNILMFYLGLELSTIPLAAMANFELEKKKSSEAAMKFIMSSGFSSGLLLFGISLLYGTSGTLNLDSISQSLSGKPLEIFAFILLLAGFGFKISAVPFHLWTADVYEGAPVGVTSYLSVISKGAILFVMLQVFYKAFQPLSSEWYPMILLIAVLTMSIGNLFALRQTNLKRFLAFSSIAQVGFILVGLSGQSTEASSSVVYFIMVYIFSNLAAFGVISVVSAMTGKETLSDYRGFYKNNPVLSWILAIALFSLAGIPPTAGFFGKFFLILAGAGKGNYWFIVLAALNIIISLYYYLRVIGYLFMKENEEPVAHIKISLAPAISFLICLGGILITGFASGAYEYIHSLFSNIP